MEIENKKQLRKYFLAQRQQLSPIQRQIWSKAIQEIFVQTFNLQNITCVHIFLPIDALAEVDTWLIIQYLQTQYPAIQIVIPKITPNSEAMESHLLLPDTNFTKNTLGVLEPENTPLIPPEQIDMLLVPLLCIDKQGFRLGYGKGYYDRYLQRCGQNIITIGLSFFEPIPQLPEKNKYDIPLHFCITPQQSIAFKSK